MATIGTHCLLELYGCPLELLDDHDYIIATLRSAAERAGATWLSHASHRFTPQGVTAVGLLSESHISIHTWPEDGFATADVFTCGDVAMPEIACEILKEAFRCTRYEMKKINRSQSLFVDCQPLETAMAPV